jgi:hypothetical protein
LPIVAALVVRLAAVVVFAEPTDRPIAYEHGVIAENLLAGRGFSVWFLGAEGPTSQQAPFVPFLLAGCYALFGVGTSAAHLAFQLLQCAAGTAAVAVIALWARRLFPDRPAIAPCAAWCAALYPPHVYMVTHIQAAVWSTLAVVLLLHAAARSDRSPHRTAVAIGLLAGWSALIDPILVLVAAVAGCAWLVGVWRRSDESARSRFFSERLARLAPPAALGCLAFTAMLAPWLVRNFCVHGEFVFVKSSFGYAFWQGNNERSRGTDKIPKLSPEELARVHSGTLVEQNRMLWEARHETLYIDDVLLKPAGYREFAGLSEPARSRLLLARSQAWIWEHPADYMRLCLTRLGYFLLWDQTNPKASHPVYRISSIVWLVLAGIGLLAARRHWGKLLPSMVAFAAVAVFHCLTIMSARFRIPVESIGLIWGAVGITPAISNVAGRFRDAWRSARRPPPDDHGIVLRGPHARASRRDASRASRRAG